MATAASADGSHALIQGSGSSWAANAVNQWVADVASEGYRSSTPPMAMRKDVRTSRTRRRTSP